MNQRRIVIAALLLFAGALAIGIPMGMWNADHRVDYGYAFPDLQDAWDAEKAKEILRTWSWTGGKEDIKRAMQLDLAFPLFYAPLLALLAWRASHARPTPWVARLGRILAFVALFGGLADIAENLTMLTMLDDPEASRFRIMVVFTVVKIAGILAPALYLLFSHLDVVRPPVSPAIATAPDAIASDDRPDM